MKHLLPVLTVCGTFTLLSPLTGATESPESGLIMTPEKMNWVDNPRVPGLSVAKIVGDAKKPGPFVHRVTFPKGRVIQAHSHPDDRTNTVISGTCYIGWGKTYDESKLVALPAGSFYTVPAGVPHFFATPDGEAVVQMTGAGITAVNFVNPAHAPKKKK